MSKLTSHSYTIYPLGSPILTSFYPLWTNYPLTLTALCSSWQPNSYIFLPLLNKLSPHFYTILPPPPLAAQLSAHFTPLWKNCPLTQTPWGVIPHTQGGGNSSKSLPLQHIAAHSYTANWVRGDNSWKVFPIQPVAEHFYKAILVRG